MPVSLIRRLHPQRAAIERALAERERTLFNLDDTIYLYDLTSTYFEGQCPRNPQAQRGYSRDHRPDCKQVVVGLVLDRDGFPKAHEVFDGNRVDRTTVADMLTMLEARTGRQEGATVVVDRGMAFADNLKEITDRGHHYLVAGRQAERAPHLDAFEDATGWAEVIRPPRRAIRPKEITRRDQAPGRRRDVQSCFAVRAARRKDRAIREKPEQRFLGDLTKLQAGSHGALREEAKVHEAIGRLKERYPRVARYYAIIYDAAAPTVTWALHDDKKTTAAQLDGGYLLKTDRPDLSDEEIWRLYVLLTRVEDAFRDMKSPLMERPIFHHLKNRVQTHIFLCVLAYHLLVAIEKRFLDHGVHTSWATLRAQLSTHQVQTIVLPATNGQTLRIRKGSTPEETPSGHLPHAEDPPEVMKPVKTWAPNESR